jgi:hypothetical protein
MNTTGITEQELIKNWDLKFNLRHLRAQVLIRIWYYYTLDIGDVCLISNASDDIEKYGWTISIFDSETCNIGDIADLTTLIRILKNNTATK